ncbi:MAG: TetR family transcriptional regulator [Pseudonocardiaceae bacterium]|nr:TetR family transcriptional regulator [Pseudonocardiaceae bacterium]
MSTPAKSGTSRRRLPREVRETQMLDAAVVVFSRWGYHSASMDEISDGAGVSKPMIYAYLGSKEDLFTACIRREGGRLMEAIAGAVGEVSRPDEQLWHGLHAFFRFVLDYRDGWIVLYRQARVQGGAFAEEIAGMRHQMILVVAQMLARAGCAEADSTPTAYALVGAAEALSDWGLEQPDVTAESLTDRLMDFAWTGLGRLGDR